MTNQAYAKRAKRIGVRGESTQELLVASSAFNEAILCALLAQRVKKKPASPALYLLGLATASPAKIRLGATDFFCIYRVLG